MSSHAIEIHGLGKQYRIKGNSTSSLLGKIARRNQEDSFWALKDLNYNLEQGKVLGVIGPNGAGKSTLLKLLSRITFPSAGKFTAHGRMSSLLEVGTGFHPELSGYDNIFLNGSILGMSKTEIKSALDEIIEFSGVENFIHMPVKHYSSGMKVRLAFSVAAHLTAEILLIDEVLAVGDASFQRKCIERMEDVSRHQGRTILFVSHNMRAVNDLCNEAIYIDGGQLVKSGTAEEITSFYNKSLEQRAISIDLADRKDREGTGSIQLQSMTFTDENGNPLSELRSGEPVTLEVKYAGSKAPTGLNVRLSIGRENDGFIGALSNSLAGNQFENLGTEGTLRCKLDKLPFMTGKYVVNARLTEHNIVTDDVKRAIVFEVKEGDYFGSGDLFSTERTGVYINQHWE
ncbi:ABC transporter ATP-binding protein [Phaeocystidibacter luteus]|uniref:ABC transporter ATP-binding protein n=1 Tax=Phaeocystidibacter luteus TaxID=911197 RepID=A0A6N6RG24_9FLAO|nr:ABC transporter ATP-binding protein [Phaeocystidibacter luteus]KAB2807746.1 ABC transporter ATP-binding protein [Phaeocystidibacter luteus]